MDESTKLMWKLFEREEATCLPPPPPPPPPPLPPPPSFHQLPPPSTCFIRCFSSLFVAYLFWRQSLLIFHQVSLCVPLFFSGLSLSLSFLLSLFPSSCPFIRAPSWHRLRTPDSHRSARSSLAHLSLSLFLSLSLSFFLFLSLPFISFSFSAVLTFRAPLQLSRITAD